MAVATSNPYGLDEIALKRLIKKAIKEGEFMVWRTEGCLWAGTGRWNYRVTNPELVYEYLERPPRDGEALVQVQGKDSSFVSDSAESYDRVLRSLFERGLQAPPALLTPWYRREGEWMLRFAVSGQDYGFFRSEYLAPLENARHLDYRLVAMREGWSVIDAPALLAYWEGVPVAAVAGMCHVPMDFPTLYI